MSKRARLRKKALRWDTRNQLELADGCLDMIHEALVGFGISMAGCPPMFYPEAINNVVVATAEAIAEWRGKPIQLEERKEGAAVIKQYMRAKYPEPRTQATGGGKG